MTTALPAGTLLQEPSWSWGEPHGDPVSPEVAEQALASLEEVDRRIATLSLGCGLSLGTVGSVLRLDASVVDWRLSEGLRRAAETLHQQPAALERGIARALRDRGGPEGRGLLADLSPEQLERLAARLASEDLGDEGGVDRAGLGIGSLGLIVLSAFVFLAYGIVRDENPLWRGKALARQGEYEQARVSFSELGPSPEGRAWTAICWLAEGEYERALAILGEPEASQYLGAFRPADVPTTKEETDPESAALLPRGLVYSGRPAFVVRAGAAGPLSLTSTDSVAEARSTRLPVPEPADGERFVRVPFPDGAAPLEPGTWIWSAPGNSDHPAAFTVISNEQRQDLRRRVLEKLTHEIPDPARIYLRVQFDLRHGLLMDAGEGLARLVELFPDRQHPRQRLAEVARALGVDPGAFLR